MDLVKELEGLRRYSYVCVRNYRTVGIGFNMDQAGSRELWKKLKIEEDFDKVYQGKTPLSMRSIEALFHKTWDWCLKRAKDRCEDLGINYNEAKEYQKFIWADLVFNTGSVNHYELVFKATDPKEVLFQARRRPYKDLDSRVAKIGYHFGLIDTIEEAKEIGLIHTKYLA